MKTLDENDSFHRVPVDIVQLKSTIAGSTIARIPATSQRPQKTREYGIMAAGLG
jgi:hypothetical protein